MTSNTSTWRETNGKRIVLDNGSFKIRVGLAGLKDETFQQGRNLIAHQKRSNDTLIGYECEKVLNESSFRYSKPHVRGVLTNFDTQLTIWAKMFHDLLEDKNGKGYSLTFINPYLLPSRSKEKFLEILFDFYSFNAVLPTK
jgi:actin-related protein